MSKFIFLDVDGTLLNAKKQVPISAKNAIKKARALGHKVFLCTGRSRVEIPASLWEIGFDGMIGSAGAYVEAEGKMLAHVPLPKEDVLRVCKYLEGLGAKFVLEANHCIYANPESARYQRERFHTAPKEVIECYVDCVKEYQEAEELEGVNKILFLTSPVSVEEIQKEFKDFLTVIRSTFSYNEGTSGEIYSTRRNKAIGIKEIVSYYGGDMKDTIGFGDGDNDFEMLKEVNMGVAMGNGSKHLKEIADMVTQTVDEDGLYLGFQTLKLCEASPLL